MYAVSLPDDLSADDAPFRDAVKRALALDVTPHEISFALGGALGLLPTLPEMAEAPPLTVPAAFAELMAFALCHRAVDRCDLLYDVLWRLKHGAPDLLTRHSDQAVARLEGYVKAVRRDIHKTHAFVRFAEREEDGAIVHVAVFEPKHFSLRRAAPFFVDRFANMCWRIETPIGTAWWDLRRLHFGPGFAAGRQPEPPRESDLWQTYYRTTFNPARLRIDAMRAEMPKHYWRNMPEAAHIPAMIRAATSREQAMIAAEASKAPRFAAKAAAQCVVAAPDIQATPLATLGAEARACTRCPLHACATQTVFGEGPETARLMLVGEQPGDQEDLAGRPFVGPAGQVLDRALEEAGIAREDCYVTNAVKHFKYEPRGKRRIHKKPSAGEVSACRWWLMREIAAVRPALIVALGATAALSLFGRPVAITKARGRVTDSGHGPVLMTVHPSYLLRLPPSEIDAEHARFAADLREAAQALADNFNCSSPVKPERLPPDAVLASRYVPPLSRSG